MKTQKPQIARPGCEADTLNRLVKKHLVKASTFRGHDGYGWNATLQIDGMKINVTDDGYGGGLQIETVDGGNFTRARSLEVQSLLDRTAKENAPKSDSQPREDFPEINGKPWIATESDGYWEIWVDNIVAHGLEQKDIRKAIGAKKIAWRTEGQQKNAHWTRPLGDEVATVESIVANAAKDGETIEWIIGVKTPLGIAAAEKALAATTVVPC